MKAKDRNFNCAINKRLFANDSQILVGIDGSDSAINAANYAVKLAKEIQAELEIIFVIRFSTGNVDAGVLPIKIEEYEKERVV